MEKTPLPATLDFERPLTTVDVVIFSVRGGALQVLMVRRPAAVDEPSEPFPGRWALPGGFVDTTRDASLQDCAARKLREKTGVTAPYLEQLGSWGDRERDPRGWSATHAWFALVHGASPVEGLVEGEGEGKGGNDSDNDSDNDNRSEAPSRGQGAQWVDVDSAVRRRLAFDHARILVAALARLRSKVEYTSLPAYLLPEPFTLPQLQQMYEIVLGRPVDKSAFRKRMLDAAFMAEVGPVDGGAGRPAMGYRLLDRQTAATFPRMFKSSE